MNLPTRGLHHAVAILALTSFSKPLSWLQLGTERTGRSGTVFPLLFTRVVGSSHFVHELISIGQHLSSPFLHVGSGLYTQIWSDFPHGTPGGPCILNLLPRTTFPSALNSYALKWCAALEVPTRRRPTTIIPATFANICGRLGSPCPVACAGIRLRRRREGGYGLVRRWRQDEAGGAGSVARRRRSATGEAGAATEEMSEGEGRQ